MHRTDVVGAVTAGQLECFRFAIGKFDGNQFGLTLRLCQIGELPADPLRSVIICHGVDGAPVLDQGFGDFGQRILVNNLACFRVALGNYVGMGVDWDRDTACLDDLEWATCFVGFGFGRDSFHTCIVPSLSRPVNENHKTPIKYVGGGGS